MSPQFMLLRFFGLLQTIAGYVIEKLSTLVLSYVYDSRRQIIKQPENDILLQPAVDIANKIRKRQLRCRDVVNSFIERIRQVNPVLNAVVADRFKQALQEAKDLDDELDSQPENSKLSQELCPLLGVPFTAKEAIAIEGLPNTSGVLHRKGVISSSDADVVVKLRQAGAIPLAVTNCSELCMWWESSNLVYGTTSNPYNTARIVGGSSGGEAAILASAGSVIGVGSDIGGSIRMPAFFCGIFGHKSTTGMVCNDGQYPVAKGEQVHFLTTGPMCRYASDLMPVFKVMTGAENVIKLKLNNKVDVSQLRFYSMEDDGGCVFVSSVHQHLINTQTKVVEVIESELGVKVVPLKISKLKLSLQMWSAMMMSAGGDAFCQLMGQNKPVNVFVELGKWLTCRGNHTLPAIGLGVLEKLPGLSSASSQKIISICDTLKQEIEDILGEDGVLLYPSHPRPAPYHNQPLTYPFNFAYTAVFNVLGMPVTQCPTGLNDQGLPIGLQVIGSRNSDRVTIAVAEFIERKLGGWVPPGHTPHTSDTATHIS